MTKYIMVNTEEFLKTNELTKEEIIKVEGLEYNFGMRMLSNKTFGYAEEYWNDYFAYHMKKKLGKDIVINPVDILEM